jgi:hypothetical protein
MKVQHVFHWPVAGVSYHKLNVIADDGTTAPVIVRDPVGGKAYTKEQAVNLASQQGPALLVAKQREVVLAQSIEAMTKPVAVASVDQKDYESYITELKTKLAATAPVKPVVESVAVKEMVK